MRTIPSCKSSRSRSALPPRKSTQSSRPAEKWNTLLCCESLTTKTGMEFNPDLLLQEERDFQLGTKCLIRNPAFIKVFKEQKELEQADDQGLLAWSLCSTYGKPVAAFLQRGGPTLVPWLRRSSRDLGIISQLELPKWLGESVRGWEQCEIPPWFKFWALRDLPFPMQRKDVGLELEPGSDLSNACASWGSLKADSPCGMFPPLELGLLQLSASPPKQTPWQHYWWEFS